MVFLRYTHWLSDALSLYNSLNLATLSSKLSAVVVVLSLLVYRLYITLVVLQLLTVTFTIITVILPLFCRLFLLFLPDTCRNSPCASGGTCTAEGEDYKCKCEPGWGGDECQCKCHLQNILPGS